MILNFRLTPWKSNDKNFTKPHFGGMFNPFYPKLDK